MPNKRFAYLLSLTLLVVTMLPVNGSTKVLDVRATLKQKIYKVGDELKPSVELINSSDKDKALTYLKPVVVTPEIWDASTNTRLANAPSVIFSQVRALQNTTLRPGEKLDLSSFSVVIEKLSPEAEKSQLSAGYRSYWYKAKSGKYFLRYRIQLKDVIPEASGEVVSNDLPFELFAK